MNIGELKAEMARQNISIPQLADIIHVSKKTLYSRFSEKTNFVQPEILAISNALSLKQEKIFEIFFAQ